MTVYAYDQLGRSENAYQGALNSYESKQTHVLFSCFSFLPQYFKNYLPCGIQEWCRVSIFLENTSRKNFMLIREKIPAKRNSDAKNFETKNCVYSTYYSIYFFTSAFLPMHSTIFFRCAVYQIIFSFFFLFH